MGCNCSCGCGEQKTVGTAKCPLCAKNGVAVPLTAVSNLVKPDKKHLITARQKYYLCLNSKCPTSYFDKSGATVLKRGNLKVELWYKENAKKKVACYCNNITYDQVKAQVIKNNKLTWKEIVSAYRKKPIAKCDKLNPTGNCCFQVFYGMVNAILKEAGRKPLKYSACC
ncbi:MAG: hypothetical protein WC632_03525 [Candidatus Margulisiibacteriota bacterium]